MKYSLFFILLLFCGSAFSQDRIELGYATTKRGIVWVRPGTPTHEPVWRIARDTNAIIWHNLTTGAEYYWSYADGVWFTRTRITSTLPPLEAFTSGLATIDNTQAIWVNDDGLTHYYDNSIASWCPTNLIYQSSPPTNVSAGVSNGSATYTTSLWQDSDTQIVYYWDGDSWEPIGGNTDLTYSGSSSPVTLNSSSGTDVTITAGTGISLSATSTNLTITNSSPDQTVSITGAGINVVTGTYPNFTVTGTEVDGNISNEGSLTVGAGSGTTSIINSNTSGSTGVTLTAGTGLSISETGNTITLTNSAPDQTVSITNGGGVSVGGTYPSFTLTAADQSATNEAQTLSVSGTTSGIISLNAISGVGGGTATIAAGTNIGVSQSGGTITINNTGAAALSGVVNQIPYFNTSTTITTEAGSGANSLYWDVTNNRLGVAKTSPSKPLDVNGDIQGSADLYLGADFKIYSSGTLVWNRNESASNLLVGNNVGNLTLSGNRNIGFGAFNFVNLTSGEQNVAVGQNALYSLTTGSGNVAVGVNSLNNLTTGGSNVAVGGTSGTSVTTGSNNFLLGAGSGAAITTQSGNVGVGFRSLHDVTSGYNVGIGYQALDGADASGTVAIGQGAGNLASTQTNSTLIGNYAGYSATAATSVFIGYGAGVGNSTSSTLAIDYNPSLSSNKTPLIGGNFSNSRVGINTQHASLARTLHVTGEARITDLTTDPPTIVLGADADGDLGTLALSGMSVSGGTLTATDGSATNEAQTLSVSGTTSGIISLNAISGVGGGTATIAAGTGITVGQSGGTITISNSSPATAGWLLDGNTIGAAKRIGSNDNFDVVVETNGIDRMWFDNAGTVSIGATQLTTAALGINGLQNATGILIAGGGSLTGPTFIEVTGSGSGSNATVLDAQVSMLNGNVEGLLKNTSTTGTGGALLTLNTHQSATGDPKIVWTTNDVTTWAAGIDNSVSGEPWKLTSNSDIGAATPAISSTTANKVGINQAAAVVTLQVTGTDAISYPSGTTAQRSAAAIPQLRHNSTFSGFEVYDPNKNYWYRLTGVSSPSVVSNTAAGTGASAGLVSGAGSNDVRGAIELTTGSASLAVGTVCTITYSNAFSGTATNVVLTPKNDAAASEIAKWRVVSETQNGFAIRAVTALTASTTYQFNYSVGQ